MTSSDKAIAELQRFERMQYFLFAGVQGLSAKSMQSLAVAFPELDRLSLMSMDLPPAFLDHIRGMKLQWLELGAMPQIDDGCVESLAAIKTLTRLSLLKCKLTPAGVKRLAVALPACRIEWDGGVVEPTPAPPPK